ncbi:MAG: UDP-4-amino-4,6-dideoxy-N-acetyl-beta-L-altrosami ne transaminase [Myxococcota bacterium]
MSELEVIPVLKPSFGEEEIEAVAEVLRSGWAGLGPKTKLFEDEFAAYLGSPHLIGFNSGTAALHLALIAAGVAVGDEVIVTPITFVSTVHVIEYLGAKPVFADVEADTLNIDPVDVERKVTARTKAILCVHYGGNPCDMERLNEIAKGRGIKIIEDAAHAAGASYKGRKIGTISELTCFSFHAVKNLAMGEGGAISCSSDETARYLREMRWMGITKDTFQRTVEDKVYAWFYEVNHLGWKYHLSDVAAAIGRVQLKRLDENNRKRKAIAQRYTEELRGLDWLETPTVADWNESSWHLYVIKLTSLKQRDGMIRWLKENRIAPGVHYYPINLQPYYQEKYRGDPGLKLAVANKIWERIISIPIFPDLTEDDQSRVIDAIKRFSG